MMIGIIIPLKAKSVAKDWEVTSGNLEATVKSVLGQTVKDFRCVIVGNDCPEFLEALVNKNNIWCEFLKYDRFPPPKLGPDEAENQLKYEFDRCNKILEGIIYLKRKAVGITHWFALDADDLISNEFIRTLKNYESFDGIIIDKGFFYFKNTGIINKENEFSAYCGSSAIISDRLIKIPDSVDDKTYRCTPFGAISHVNMKVDLRSRGYSVGICKDRIVMYVRDNGENISNAAYYDTFFKRIKKFIKALIKYRFFTKNIRRSFGV